MTETGNASAKVNITALVAETTSVQAIGTMSVLAIPAIAPEVAQALAVPASLVGYQVGLVYTAAMLLSLWAGSLVALLGPWRTGQTAMILTALGCATASIPRLWATIVGSLLLGCSYGLINPAASELLIRYSPTSRRNLIFSLKQTGVPLGGMAAGLMGPPIALAFGWNALLLFIGAAALALAAVSEIGRQNLDEGAGRRQRPPLHLLPLLQGVLRNRKLFWLVAASFCFSAVQLSFIAFLVVLLVDELRFDLAGAGAVLAAAQVAGSAGRVLWGAVADRVRNGIAVLLGLALMMTVAFSSVAGFVVSASANAAVAAFLMLGLSAVGWNGVYLSEVARHSPAGSVSATTGAAMFFTFAGVVAGPSVFSVLHGVLGSYAGCYAFLAALSCLGALMVRAAGP